VVTRLLPGLEVNEQACATACSEEVHAASEACRLAVEGTPFRAAYAQVARQLQDGSFKPAPITSTNAVHETGQLALRKLAVTLAGSKNWIGDRRRFLATTTERLFNWP
jgi:argininosuccinate lyase